MTVAVAAILGITLNVATVADVDPLPPIPDPPVIHQNEDHGSTCEDIEADCQKVRNVIRDVFPDDQEEWAIDCFTSESGLFKWSNHPDNDPEARDTEYMGIAQMGEDERESTGWGWAVRKQIEAALRWLRATSRASWTGSAC